jgi:preprotein translocase subunit SecD
VQDAFAALDCAASPNPTGGEDAPADYVIACDSQTGLKYVLGPAGVHDGQISGASATVDPTTNEWKVLLDFDSNGAHGWSSLTARAGSQPDMPQCSPPMGCNGVAIVLDGIVQETPRIMDPQGIASGRAELTGGFTESRAKMLAAMFEGGALPIALSVSR